MAHNRWRVYWPKLQHPWILDNVACALQLHKGCVCGRRSWSEWAEYGRARCPGCCETFPGYVDFCWTCNKADQVSPENLNNCYFRSSNLGKYYQQQPRSRARYCSECHGAEMELVEEKRTLA